MNVEALAMSNDLVVGAGTLDMSHDLLELNAP